MLPTTIGTTARINPSSRLTATPHHLQVHCRHRNTWRHKTTQASNPHKYCLLGRGKRLSRFLSRKTTAIGNEVASVDIFFSSTQNLISSETLSSWIVLLVEDDDGHQALFSRHSSLHPDDHEQVVLSLYHATAGKNRTVNPQGNYADVTLSRTIP